MARKCCSQQYGTMIVPDKWSNKKYSKHATFVLRVTRFWVVMHQEEFFTML